MSRRYEGLDAKRDPLVAILAAVPFELFRPQLKAALVAGGLRTADAQRKSAAGRNQHGSMGGKFLRTIGILRAAARIGLQNLADTMRRLVVLERCAMAAG